MPWGLPEIRSRSRADLVLQRRLLVEDPDQLLLDPVEEGADLVLVIAPPAERGTPEVGRLQLGRGETLSAGIV